MSVRSETRDKALWLGALSMLLILLGTVSLFSAKTAAPQDAVVTVAPARRVVPAAPVGLKDCPGAVLWSDADVGDSGTFYGPLRRGKALDEDIHLVNVGNPWGKRRKDRLTLVLPNSLVESGELPDLTGRGTGDVCVTGTVTQYNGVPQIQVTEAGQLVLVD